MKNISYRTWGIVTGVIWLLATLLSIIPAVISYLNYTSINTWAGWALSVVFAIALLIDNLPMARVSQIITAAWTLVSIVEALIGSYHTAWVLFIGFFEIAESVLVVVALFSLGKNGRFLCLAALGCAIFANITASLMSFYVFEVPFEIDYSGIFIWVAEFIPLSFYIAAKPKPLTAAPASAAGQPYAASDSLSSIEKLTALKTLLEKGILTQEEFEEKKNELLKR